MDVAVATNVPAKSVWSTDKVKKKKKKAVMGSKSCWQGHFVSQPAACLESCRVFGIGVWLCFICCPLQGGSNLQPTHEPVNPKPIFWTKTLRNFSVLTLDWAGHWHYQLDSYQMKLQVHRPWITSAFGSVRFGIWSRTLWQRRGREARSAQMSSSTSAWNSRVVAWRSSNQQDRRPAPPAQMSETESWFGFWWTWLD